MIGRQVIERAFRSPYVGPGVYFIEDGDGLVKIGHGSNVEARLRRFQTASPRRLFISQLIRIEPFVERLSRERELHARFGADRVRGEWFRLSPQIRALIHDLDES